MEKAKKDEVDRLKKLRKAREAAEADAEDSVEKRVRAEINLVTADDSDEVVVLM